MRSSARFCVTSINTLSNLYLCLPCRMKLTIWVIGQSSNVHNPSLYFTLINIASERCEILFFSIRQVLTLKNYFFIQCTFHQIWDRASRWTLELSLRTRLKINVTFRWTETFIGINFLTQRVTICPQNLYSLGCDEYKKTRTKLDIVIGLTLLCVLSKIARDKVKITTSLDNIKTTVDYIDLFTCFLILIIFHIRYKLCLCF